MRVQNLFHFELILTFGTGNIPTSRSAGPVVNMCLYCFAFSNPHRYLVNHTYQSGLNDQNDEDDKAMSEAV